MKILFISDNFPPEVNAPATRTYEHCRRWVERGVDVTVITCAPNFPQGKIYAGYTNKLCQTEMVDGIQVIRVWSYVAANMGFLKRIIDYLSFALMAAVFGTGVKCDVIIATSPQFFTTFAGYILSLLKRRPWIFELRDIWPESISTVGAMKKGTTIKILEKIEMSMYRKADLVVPVTEAFKRQLISRGISSNKIDVVTNGVLLDSFKPRPKDQELVTLLGLQGKFVFGYIGTHGLAHSLDFVIESLPELQTEQFIHFLFVGDGAAKPTIVERAHELGLTNITFCDPVPKDQIARYLSVMDAALVPLKRADTFRNVIPSKIFEAAAMQKPILLGVDGQAREILEKYRAGIFFEPEDAGDFTAKLRAVATDETLRTTMQAGCNKLAQAYDRNVLADSMLERVMALVESRTSTIVGYVRNS